MFKKILLILLFSLNFFIQTSTTILLPTTYVNNSTDEFFEMISQYESFNEKLFDLYYQEYQVNNNIILSLNKVNYPNFFNDQKIYNSFTFKGGLFVNKNYYLQNNYIPDTLIPVTITKINRKQETMLIDKTTLTYAKAMFDTISFFTRRICLSPFVDFHLCRWATIRSLHWYPYCFHILFSPPRQIEMLFLR